LIRCPFGATGIDCLAELVCHSLFHRVFLFRIVLVEMAVEALSQVLRKVPFQLRQRQLGDGLGGVVTFSEQGVDVGPAQAPEADLGEARPFSVTP